MGARLVIAGSASSVGKTTVATGLMAAFRRRGLAVQPFKTGPDYLDPTYHTLAAGVPSRNLDTWLVPHDRLRSCFGHAVRGADIAVIEGMMGLYDGLDYRGDAGSTAELAKLLDAPVILVLDVGAQARSAAATALGFLHLDPGVRIAGFICNRVGGPGHYRGITGAIEDATGLPVLGGLPFAERAAIPERHLGLMPTGESGNLRPLIDGLADMMADTCDLDTLLAVARSAPPMQNPATLPFAELSGCAPDGARPVIAVARDRAFSFYYEDNLDLLRLAGADIIPFSPLTDSDLPSDTAALYIGGGYPEIYAAELAANDAMRRRLRETIAAGVPCYAECGGLMYLTEALVDNAGVRHPMANVLPGHAVMNGRWPHLGYTTARALRDTPLLRAGEEVRGHEFHYSAWEGVPANAPRAYHLRDARGDSVPDGYAKGNLLASYVHLHFGAMPALAARFVDAASKNAAYRQRAVEKREPA
jgi:cobyrinic acid a,c-diamide synthase